ncbi:MAG TPA: hypothetical protein VEC99_03970 [Clostridia bacterium]|nr:hypothetical protein [Clostridia bacterium]
MKLVKTVIVSLALITCWGQARASYYDLSLPAKINHCLLVAEVRVDDVDLRQRDPALEDYELVCRCTVLQGFKLPAPTNTVTITFKYINPRPYKGKTFLVFAVEDEIGYRPYRNQKPVIGYRPYRDQRGLIEEGQSYKCIIDSPKQNGEATYREISYSELIERVKAIVEANSSSESNYYQRFLSLVNTNEVRPQPGLTNVALVDKKNIAPKLANQNISFQKLIKEGVVGEISLGMTIEAVVSHWGKPLWLHPNCDGGHRLAYDDCSLIFKGNLLNKIRFGETLVFDNGLSARSNLKEWLQGAGPPTLRKDTFNRSLLVYETRGKLRTVLLLTFASNGEMNFPPTFYLDAPLTNWSGQTAK